MSTDRSDASTAADSISGRSARKQHRANGGDAGLGTPATRRIAQDVGGEQSPRSPSAGRSVVGGGSMRALTKKQRDLQYKQDKLDKQSAAKAQREATVKDDSSDEETVSEDGGQESEDMMNNSSNEQPEPELEPEPRTSPAEKKKRRTNTRPVRVLSSTEQQDRVIADLKSEAADFRAESDARFGELMEAFERQSASGGGPRHGKAEPHMSVQQAKVYTGQRIVAGRNLTYTHYIKVLQDLYRHRSELGGSSLKLIDLMDEVSRTHAIAVLQINTTYGDDYQDDAEYTQAMLAEESEGKILEAMFQNLEPTSPEQYCKILMVPQMGICGSYLTTRFAQDVMPVIMEYCQTFTSLHSLLRFDPDAFDRGEMYGAGNNASEYEPPLHRAFQESVKVLNKPSRTRLMSLESMFLSGMGECGSQLYSMFPFHNRYGNDEEYNVKKMPYATFIRLFRRHVVQVAQAVKQMDPVVRMLASMNRESRYGEKTGVSDSRAAVTKPQQWKSLQAGTEKAAQPPWKRPERVEHKDRTAVQHVDDVQEDVNSGVMVVSGGEQRRRPSVCMSMITGQNCRDGSNCPYPHDKASFDMFKQSVNDFTGGVNMWKPSPERRQSLVPSTGRFVNGDARVVQRPHVVNHVDQEQEPEREWNEGDSDEIHQRQILGYDEEDSEGY
jgi:hypothetical protein